MAESIPQSSLVMLATALVGLLGGATGMLIWLVFRQRSRFGPGWANRIPPIQLDLFSAGCGLTAFCLIVLPGGGALLSLAMVAAALLSCRAAGLNAWAALGMLRARPLTALALPPVVYAGIFLPLYFAAMGSYLLCHALHIPFEPQELVLLFRGLKTPLQIAGFVLMALVVAPLSEEMFFRGLLHGWFKSFMPRRLSMAATSLLFAAVHWHIPAFLPLAFLGLVLVLLYEATDSLWPCIALHAVFNFVTLLAVSVFPKLVGV